MQKARLYIHEWRMEWRCTGSKDVSDPTHDLHPQQSCKPRPLHWGTLTPRGRTQNMLQTFLFLALHTILCVAVNFGRKFWEQKEQNPHVISVRKGNTGMKKLMDRIGNSVFHTNTHQEHTVKYKGYIYIYMCMYIYIKRMLSQMFITRWNKSNWKKFTSWTSSKGTDCSSGLLAKSKIERAGLKNDIKLSHILLSVCNWFDWNWTRRP